MRLDKKSRSDILTINIHVERQKALLAHLVEHRTCNAEVVSSNPTGSTKNYSELFQSSTAVVQLTVNQLVAGSIPASGAKQKELNNESNPIRSRCS